MMNSKLLLALCSTMSTLVAQTLIVPSGFDVADGPGQRMLPGLSTTHRQQIIFDAALVAGLVGRQTDAILIRRDWSNPGALPTGTAQVVVAMGVGAFDSRTVSSDFGANLPTPHEVFRGAVVAPLSPAVSGTVDWGPSNVVRIDLTSPYQHAGGPLVLDITGLTEARIDWPIDAAEETLAGSAITLGEPCGQRMGPAPTASVGIQTLVVGRTSNFVLVGEAARPAWMLVGVSTFSTPINLAAIGMPGCMLHVDSFTAVPTATSAPGVVAPVFGGTANLRIHWPASATLCGATVVTQWAQYESTGLATSNALVCTLASGTPGLGMVNLTSQAGEPPLVQSFAVPVIGFEVRNP